MCSANSAVSEVFARNQRCSLKNKVLVARQVCLSLSSSATKGAKVAICPAEVRDCNRNIVNLVYRMGVAANPTSFTPRLFYVLRCGGGNCARDPQGVDFECCVHYRTVWLDGVHLFDAVCGDCILGQKYNKFFKIVGFGAGNVGGLGKYLRQSAARTAQKSRGTSSVCGVRMPGFSSPPVRKRRLPKRMAAAPARAKRAEE